MPNWCNNTLEVMSDDTKKLQAFKRKAKAKGTALSLHKIHPEPKDNEDWHNWRLNNWGTKWDVEATIVDEDENFILYEFDTAWSPPAEWLEYVAKKYKGLDFRLKFEEPGMAFMGVATVYEGDYSFNSIDY